MAQRVPVLQAISSPNAVLKLPAHLILRQCTVAPMYFGSASAAISASSGSFDTAASRVPPGIVGWVKSKQSALTNEPLLMQALQPDADCKQCMQSFSVKPLLPQDSTTAAGPKAAPTTRFRSLCLKCSRKCCYTLRPALSLCPSDKHTSKSAGQLGNSCGDSCCSSYGFGCCWECPGWC